VVLATGNCGHCGRRVLARVEGPAPPAGSPSLTAEEFGAAAAAYTWRTLRSVLLVFAAAFAYLVLVALLRNPLLAASTRLLGEAYAFDGLGLLALPVFAIVFGGLALVAARERRRPRDPRLACPQCGKCLAENRHFVTATHRCWKCDAAVLSEPPPASGVLPLAEFQRRNAVYTRFLLGVVAGMLALFLAGSLPLIAYEDELRARLGEPGADIFYVAAVIVLWGGGGAATLLLERRSPVSRRLDCPQCGKSLANLRHLVVASRHCAHCGRRILAEAERAA
jgi:hypothetical protein